MLSECPSYASASAFAATPDTHGCDAIPSQDWWSSRRRAAPCTAESSVLLLPINEAPSRLFPPPQRRDSHDGALHQGTFALGAVNEKFKKDQRVWIVRQEDGGFFAISAICTHLGCTPNWFANDNKFKLLGKVMASVAPLHRVRHQPWACPGALSRVISNRRSVGSSTLLVVLRMRCPCDGR
jgi:hypothetical protein